MSHRWHTSNATRLQNEHRAKEFAREEFARNVSADKAVRAGLNFDERAENTRRLRELELRRQSESQRVQAEEAQRDNEERVRRAEAQATQRAQAEVAARQQERDTKIRQAIREASPELKELERKLKEAEARKTHLVQMKQKVVEHEQLKATDAMLANQYFNDSKEMVAAEEAARKREEERKRQYQDVLQHQLEEKEDMKQKEYDNFLKEKEKIDAIVQKILADDRKQAKIRLDKQKETKEYIDQFVKDRTRWQAEESARIAEENRQIELHARTQLARENATIEKKKGEEEVKQRLYDQLVGQMQSVEKARQEFEDLRLELALEEQEEQARVDERERMEKRIRQKLEMLDAYRDHILSKKRKQEHEEEEENVYREKMMSKFAEESRLEQMADAKRRVKQQEHRRAVEQMIDERRAAQAERLKEEERETQQLQEIENFRREVVEQERQRILREHASGLAGFLPKGVLRDERDLALLDNQLKRMESATVGSV